MHISVGSGEGCCTVLENPSAQIRENCGHYQLQWGESVSSTSWAMWEWGSFSFLIFLGRIFKRRPCTILLKNNSGTEGQTFLVCSWHIFLLCYLLLSNFWWCFSQLMPTMHFRCLVEEIVVLLYKYVRFCFNLYWFKKISSYIANILY